MKYLIVFLVFAVPYILYPVEANPLDNFIHWINCFANVTNGLAYDLNTVLNLTGMVQGFVQNNTEEFNTCVSNGGGIINLINFIECGINSGASVPGEIQQQVNTYLTSLTNLANIGTAYNGCGPIF